MADYFKIKTRDSSMEERTLVGAEIPISDSEYLSLFCIANKKPKSAILRTIINTWVKTAKKDFPKKDLIKILVMQGADAWFNRKNRKMSFDYCILKQQKELLRKGLPEKVVEKIIQKITDAKNSKSG
jgi:hypothetical protein